MPHPPHPAPDTPISPGFVKLALEGERYVLPWVYACFAAQRVDAMRTHYQSYLKVLSANSPAIDPVLQNIAAATLARDFLLILLMLFTGLTLLFSRAPVVLPDKLKHVLVPLAMSYYFLLYGMIDLLPAPLRTSLWPPRFQGWAAVGGLSVSVLGYAVAIWALVHLGRSFSILVSVRKIVSTGPYARVRHPIYLGYVIDLCGLLLVSSSIAMLVLGAGFVLLLNIRARLEEEMLCAADEGYRAYASRTHFLFPRFFQLRRKP